MKQKTIACTLVYGIFRFHKQLEIIKTYIINFRIKPFESHATLSMCNDMIKRYILNNSC